MHAPVTSRAICASCRHALRTSFSPLSPRTRSYATAAANRHDRPLRMAVIGSGPAGFYTAYRVMSKIQGAKVDMYEALPVPYGLVRFGVAPDHPEVKVCYAIQTDASPSKGLQEDAPVSAKFSDRAWTGLQNCQEKFEEVASSPDFTFIGNVSVGHPSTHQGGGSISLASVLRHYDAVVFSYGASKDRKLGVPGESLKGVYSAREFVGWYNGLPEWAGLAPNLASGDEAVIIGQGNVALDCARMLLEDVDKLRKTDIADYAIETLSKSRIKRVHVVGRRGALQAAFTIKEARELMKLSDVGFHPIDRSLIPEDLKALPRAPRRLMEVLVKGSAADAKTTPKSWSLDFCLSPQSFLASSSDASRVGATAFERTSLSSTFEPSAHAAGTGETMQLPSSLVFRSIGYRSEPLQGFSELDIPFDERRGVIANDGLGRVVRETRTVAATMEQAQYPGLYCAGWVKRGPTGVIASTMEDAFTTGDVIASDWASGAAFLEKEYSGQKSGWEGVLSEGDADGARVVQWNDWQQIDQAERSRGQAKGKEREKFTTTTDMLNVLS